MSKLSDRANYLRGLAEGMELNPEKNTHKLIQELIELTCEMAGEIEKLNSRMDDLNDFVEVIDSDLADMEVVVEEMVTCSDEDDMEQLIDEYSSDEDEDEDEDDDSEEEDKEDDEENDDLDADDNGENGFFINVYCPSCGAPVQVNVAKVDLDQPVPCPACGEELFPEELDDEQEETLAAAAALDAASDDEEEIDQPEE